MVVILYRQLLSNGVGTLPSKLIDFYFHDAFVIGLSTFLSGLLLLFKVY